MSAYSPTYRSIAAHLTPLADRAGKRLLSNPALLPGSAEPQAGLANVLAFGGQYYFTGPAVQINPVTQAEFQQAVVGGAAAVARFNQGQVEARRIHYANTHAAALAGVWQLVSAHFGIADAAQQVMDEQLRMATAEHRSHEERRTQAERAATVAETAFERMRRAHAAFLASYRTEQRPAAIQECDAADEEFMAALPGTAVWVRADEEPEGLVLGLVGEAYERGDVRTGHGVNNWGHFCPSSYSRQQAQAFFAAATQLLEYACSLG